MYFAVETTYHAGGRISYHMFTIHSPIKPENKEEETPLHTIVTKYFNDENEAIKYAKRFDNVNWNA